GSEHENARVCKVSIRSHSNTHLKPRHFGHHPVKNNEIRTQLTGSNKTSLTVSLNCHSMTSSFKAVFDKASNVWVIFYDKNLSHHLLLYLKHCGDYHYSI